MSPSASVRPAGLRTVIYQVADLAAAKQWYSELFQRTPYFDEPFYVGYSVGGYELGLHPADAGAAVGPGGTTAYWGVTDLAAMLAQLATRAIHPVSPMQDVGGGIRVATIQDPFGNFVGLIENPHFTLTDAPE